MADPPAAPIPFPMADAVALALAARIERIADAVAALRPDGAARPQVAVHEEWRPTDEARIEVAVYLRAATG